MDFEEWMENTFQEPVWDEGWTRADMKAAWQASRENQQEYPKHEFCLKSGCGFYDGACPVDARHCKRTAKEFHHWLKANGYRIVRD